MSYFSASQLSKRFEDSSSQRISRQFFKVPTNKKGITLGKWDAAKKRKARKQNMAKTKTMVKNQIKVFFADVFPLYLWFSPKLFYSGENILSTVDENITPLEGNTFIG